MLKEIKEKRLIETDVIVSKKLICDICHNEITPNSYFYSCTANHYDWGNDSRDSIEHFDVCGYECLETLFYDYINLNNEYITSGLSSRTGELSIERECYR